MWDLIVSVPDHCLSFYFAMKQTEECSAKNATSQNVAYANISAKARP